MQCDEMALRFGILLRILSRGESDVSRQKPDLTTLAGRLHLLDPDTEWFQFESGLYDLAYAILSILASRTLELSVHQVPRPSSCLDAGEMEKEGVPPAHPQTTPRTEKERQELDRLIEALESAYETFGSPSLLERQEALGG